MEKILLTIAAIGGFIKIIESSVKIIKRTDIAISNARFYRRMHQNMKKYKKEKENAKA